ncbi:MULTISPECIES: mycothiol conjugate amidase Mca [unclassified Curtobacterium]|uniref:mycothiol conjugate amidase Mca n=1 Tax=unclassified Curtobacterium TaxID=257496 RepID=UPI000D823C7B|nr:MULTISPECIES: mycothiol conjugate amidase Mca [unclassified Curtobacterium]PYY34929.1 mycothiol conjugate amidase Mca [Curtobacterium sp. MCPF17_046]PYY49608.1 mycothiol conjugate amidase Mca [Curtobacterium sp. MCBD17_023]PZE95300.1 mycothiol conjugate amidase Mca [Curtobacterium sp. MCBD17_008]
MPRRLLAVHAHPDDESSKGAATAAKYVADGAEVLVVSCTGGEAGDILNEQLPDASKARAHRDMAGFRRTEMAAAQAALGIDHVWLGYHDSGLPDTEQGETVRPGTFATVPLEYSTAALVRVVRRFRPHVLVTYDENGGYPHPDHIRTHEVSVAAWRDAADPEKYPEAGPAWSVSKLYYERTMNPRRFSAFHEALRERDPENPLLEQLGEWVQRFADRPDLATSHVDVHEYFEARDAALRAHASQVPPDSPFFYWPNDLLAEVWPTEDYQLVEARVPTELPESDLFAGIPSEEDAHA